MKILLIASGTRGDVQPFVALGDGLAAHGHKVTLAAPKNFSGMIEAAGLAFHPLPMDMQELVERPEIKAAMTSLAGRVMAYRWASDLMNQQLSAVWTIGLDVAPDLILHHFKAGIAPQLARHLGAISIPVMLQPGFMPTSDYPQFLISSRSLGRLGNLASHKLIMAAMRMGSRMMIRRWTKATGTDIGPKMDPLGGYSAHGKANRLHAYSPHLFPRPATWPDTEIQTGYLFTKPENWSPPVALESFLAAGDPVVYAGFGSMPGIDTARTTEALLGALRLTGLRAVAATGWGGIGHVETSDQILPLDFAPHTWLFPRMDAVIHHGGSGTTHEGLRWGRPSIICPVLADQPFFGARVAALGAGPTPIPLKRLTAEKLARALETALSKQTRARAEAIGDEMQSEDGVARAVELVDRIASKL